MYQNCPKSPLLRSHLRSPAAIVSFMVNNWRITSKISFALKRCPIFARTEPKSMNLKTYESAHRRLYFSLLRKDLCDQNKSYFL